MGCTMRSAIQRIAATEKGPFFLAYLFDSCAIHLEPDTLPETNIAPEN